MKDYTCGMGNENMSSGLLDSALEHITSYEELNANSSDESNKKFLELLTDEDLKGELIKIGSVARIMRTHLQRPQGTFFGEDMGFPQEMGPNKDLESFHALKTGDVLAGYKKWVENEPEDMHTLFPGDKAKILYALGDGYDFFKAYFYIRDSDSWKNTEGRLNSTQSYKSDKFPNSSDIEGVREYFKREL